jgi:NAD(P)-dependent dehydrogenase (short-subunit alcohol dehydrogenase family)
MATATWTPRRPWLQPSRPQAATPRLWPSTSPTLPQRPAALEALLLQGPIQVVVNNAGIHDDAVFPGMQLRQWQQVIDVSLNGFFHVTQP